MIIILVFMKLKIDTGISSFINFIEVRKMKNKKLSQKQKKLKIVVINKLSEEQDKRALADISNMLKIKYYSNQEKNYEKEKQIKMGKCC